MNNEVSAPNALVANLLDREGEPIGSTVLAKGDLTVTKSSHDPFIVGWWSSLPLEEKLRPSLCPVDGQGA